jgi:integrase/recombinase XerC
LFAALDGGDLAAVDEAKIRAAIAADFRSGKSPATLSRRLSAWRMFLDYAVKRGVIAANPAREVRAPRAGLPLPKALTPDEAARFFAPKVKTPLECRDAAMFELLYSSALRVGELVALDAADLDCAAAIVRVRSGKGGVGREVPVGGGALRALAKWLAMRAAYPQKNPADSGALFIAADGKRLSARAVQLRMRKWARKSGFSRAITPHQLRHSCASHLLQSSGDLRAVQEMLGHRDIASTQVYTHLDFQALAAVYDKSHPRARLKSKSPPAAG